MNHNLESEQRNISLAEATKFLLGASIRSELIKAIIEAKNEKKPIPRKEDLIFYLNRVDARFHWQQAYNNFNQALQREKGIKSKISFRFKLLRTQPMSEREKKNFFEGLIVTPLAGIYARIEGKEPDPETPWLGEFLLKAVEEPEKTNEVFSFLSQYGLNPQALVHEIDDSLDSDLGKG